MVLCVDRISVALINKAKREKDLERLWPNIVEHCHSQTLQGKFLIEHVYNNKMYKLNADKTSKPMDLARQMFIAHMLEAPHWWKHIQYREIIDIANKLKI